MFLPCFKHFFKKITGVYGNGEMRPELCCCLLACRGWLKESREVKISHVFRQQNVDADAISKIAVNMTSD